MPRRASRSLLRSSRAMHRSRAALLALRALSVDAAEAVCRAMWDEPAERFRLHMRSDAVAEGVLRWRWHSVVNPPYNTVLFHDLARSGRPAWEAAVDRSDGEFCTAIRAIVDWMPRHPAVSTYLDLRRGDAASRNRQAGRRAERRWAGRRAARRAERRDDEDVLDAWGRRARELWRRLARAARLASLAANNREPARALARPAELRTCRECRRCCDSRSQLFRHLAECARK